VTSGERRTSSTPYPLCFSEVIGNKRLICLRVQKTQKTGESWTENKGVSESSFAKSEEKCEVAEKPGIRRILRWAGEWCDAGRRTGSVALATDALSQRFRRSSRSIIVEMVAVRTGC
jgi:hypothetical protein